MNHGKGWSFDKIKKMKNPLWGEVKETRAGRRDFSITDRDDEENIRFRKTARGLEIRVYSRKHEFKEGEYQKCDLGHRHPKTISKTFCWATVYLQPAALDELRSWFSDGHPKWSR